MAAERATMPEPPDRALVGLVDTTGQDVPFVYERDDSGGDGGEADHWYDQELDAYTWGDITAEVSEGRMLVRLYREDDPTVAIIPVPPSAPDVTIVVTAFTVSPLPADDPDRKHCEVFVHPRPGERAVVTPGPGVYLDAGGSESYGVEDPAAHWHSWGRAVELAAEAARGMGEGLRQLRRLQAERAEATR